MIVASKKNQSKSYLPGDIRDGHPSWRAGGVVVVHQDGLESDGSRDVEEQRALGPREGPAVTRVRAVDDVVDLGLPSPHGDSEDLDLCLRSQEVGHGVGTNGDGGS